jgi:hypothetical protein
VSDDRVLRSVLQEYALGPILQNYVLGPIVQNYVLGSMLQNNLYKCIRAVWTIILDFKVF